MKRKDLVFPLTPGTGTLGKYPSLTQIPQDNPILISGQGLPRLWKILSAFPSCLRFCCLPPSQNTAFLYCWEHLHYLYFCNSSRTGEKLAVALTYGTFITTCHSQQKITWKKLLQDTKKWLAGALIIFQLAFSTEGSRSTALVCKHGAQTRLCLYTPRFSDGQGASMHNTCGSSLIA